MSSPSPHETSGVLSASSKQGPQTQHTDPQAADVASPAGAGKPPIATVLQTELLPAALNLAELPVAQVIAAQKAQSRDAAESRSAAPLDASVEIAAARQEDAVRVGPGASVAEEVAAALPVTGASEATPAAPAELPATVPVLTVEASRCPACGAPLAVESQFCQDCGYALSDGEAQGVPMAAALPETEPLPAGTLIAGRYEILAELSRRPPTLRYRAADRSQNGRVVVLVQQALSETSNEKQSVTVGRFRLPMEVGCNWPELGWEVALLERLAHPCWPRVLDILQEGHAVFAVEEAAEGPDLWTIFDDPSLSMEQRFEQLAQFAEGLKALAQAGAIPEYLKPELLRQNGQGQLMLTDLSLLVPLPCPARTLLAATPYTPPELVLDATEVDARSPMYSFGAVLYALYLGHELTETDFERQWVPKSLVFRFPDAHPAFARLVMKTFVREKEHRFPTEEAARTDPSGWDELARALRCAGRQLSVTRLDTAGWSNTGKLRTNNEDAFALWHSSSGLEEDLRETVLAILCDGMGGYEAGEVAAAMAIEQIRQRFLQSEYANTLLDQNGPAAVDWDACRKFLFDMFREVNQYMYQFSRSPQGKRGMGCTCELLYIRGNRALIVHVGDSRTYHYTDGQLRQLTRDQTLVNRLVELGQLTPEEAENHPRKNELQQALGAQPFVEPQTLTLQLKPGDWLLLCSDGLTNHVDHATLTEMLQRADSAEMCARRLVNLANAYGGSDNTTVIAIRCL
ncbi:Putative protein phosphatase 2C-type [bacterium HR36]|nr:Putative protein phosphatase 2C-type [bacterium HR36]